MAFSYLRNRRWAGDPRFTNHTAPVGSALAKVRQLNSYYFYFNELGKAFGYGHVEDGGAEIRQVGLIAQELSAIEPSLVKPMDDEWTTYEDQTYYWVDYEALNILCLDALNELNVKADNIKTQLGMSVETYPAIYSGLTPQLPSDQYEITGINVTPVKGAEGTEVTWTLTGTDLPKDLTIPFKLTGTFNHADIAGVVEESNKSELVICDPEEFNDVPGARAELGDAFGSFVVNNSGSATIKMMYVRDSEVEGDETITMSLLSGNDYFGKTLPVINTTATITDS
jgi:hypothetical protein|tara:strand:+ start:9112 stop:9960 length:849 start_codon:yes stop_codon:yes gene_type:complete